MEVKKKQPTKETSVPKCRDCGKILLHCACEHKELKK